MSYEVRCGDRVFPGLSATEALTKLNELSAQGEEDLYLYDGFGDPMGRVELEEIAGSA
jgi:hypothetical protein